eukprot:scaffold22908_cov53-Cyclotella_meneghiniana.AAC.1
MTTADTSITNRSNKKRKANTADLIQSNACVSIKDAMRILKEEVESNGSSDQMKALARILLMDSAESAAEKKSAVRKAAAAIRGVHPKKFQLFGQSVRLPHPLTHTHVDLWSSFFIPPEMRDRSPLLSPILFTKNSMPYTL